MTVTTTGIALGFDISVSASSAYGIFGAELVEAGDKCLDVI
jgi:hypothetical protein